MRGQGVELCNFLEGKQRFVIPVYQRNYDWKEEQCKQLFTDIVSVIQNDRQSHFFGSIVFKQSGTAFERDYIIIDGQQRITTVSILLTAIYTLLSKSELRSENENLGQEIYETFLVNKFQKKEDLKVKLKSIKKDEQAYKAILAGEDFVNVSNITSNYKLFCDLLKQSPVSVEQMQK